MIPRTLTPPLEAGRNTITVAGLTMCTSHLVTSQLFTVRNPQTGKEVRLDGKPYQLSIALCGGFGEWFAPEPTAALCPLCAAVYAERGGPPLVLDPVPAAPSDEGLYDAIATSGKVSRFMSILEHGAKPALYRQG